MTAASFDQETFAVAVGCVITARGLTDREAARQAGVASSTITRTVRQAFRPDVDSLAALADWAELPLDLFLRRARPLNEPGSLRELRRLVAALKAATDAAEAAMTTDSETERTTTP